MRSADEIYELKRKEDMPGARRLAYLVREANYRKHGVHWALWNFLRVRSGIRIALHVGQFFPQERLNVL